MIELGTIWHKSTCQQCGRQNIGFQTRCLVCKSDLGYSLNQTDKDIYKKQRCPICHTKLKKDAKFCTQCGASVLNIKKSSLEPIYKCPSCDSIVNKGQKFCTSCGYKLPENLEAVVEESSNIKKCSNCGAELKLGAKFCTECGTKV